MLNDAAENGARRAQYLRLSVTDRCNLRCVYCMPDEPFVFKPHETILRLEEMARFARAALAEGIDKVRLTGGEPLVRKNLAWLVAELAAMPGLADLSLTTNGVLLGPVAEELRRAGLRRVNISLDSLDPRTYAELTRGQDIAPALAGIDAALAAGLQPVKINVVVHDNTLEELDRFVASIAARPLHVRFIERMNLADPAAHVAGNATTRELLRALEAAGFTPTDAPRGFGPALTFARPGMKGTLGVIHNAAGHNCARCNRLRLTADGRLKPCLFSGQEFEVFSLLRGGASENELRAVIARAIREKPRSAAEAGKTETRVMREIGG
jgi:cyclic pyranopterin phosphate synthase